MLAQPKASRGSSRLSAKSQSRNAIRPGPQSVVYYRGSESSTDMIQALYHSMITSRLTFMRCKRDVFESSIVWGVEHRHHQQTTSLDLQSAIIIVMYSAIKGTWTSKIPKIMDPVLPIVSIL